MATLAKVGSGEPTKAKRIITTRALCCVCGKAMVAHTELDAALMNRFPRDGRWSHPECRARGRG